MLLIEIWYKPKAAWEVSYFLQRMLALSSCRSRYPQLHPILYDTTSTLTIPERISSSPSTTTFLYQNISSSSYCQLWLPPNIYIGFTLFVCPYNFSSKWKWLMEFYIYIICKNSFHSCHADNIFNDCGFSFFFLAFDVKSFFNGLVVCISNLPANGCLCQAGKLLLLLDRNRILLFLSALSWILSISHWLFLRKHPCRLTQTVGAHLGEDKLCL